MKKMEIDKEQLIHKIRRECKQEKDVIFFIRFYLFQLKILLYHLGIN